MSTTIKEHNNYRLKRIRILLENGLFGGYTIITNYQDLVFRYAISQRQKGIKITQAVFYW